MTLADTLGHQAKVSKRPVNRIACVPNPIRKSSSMACHDPLDHALPLVTPNASTPATVHGYGSAAEVDLSPCLKAGDSWAAHRGPDMPTRR